ncbi:MAG: tautomerase family protein [Candidatus Methanomethylophilaceae archaeon]|nr:tautomerase family protein [Candidatus Methanomethylophilaceae archaeon]
MPVITIDMLPRDYAKKSEIAKVFTDEMSRIAGIPKEAIVVLFHELSPEDFATGGEMLAERIRK